MDTGFSFVSLFLEAGIVARLVLGTLLLASIASWAIILFKWIGLRKAEADNRRVLELYAKAEDLLDIERGCSGQERGSFGAVLEEAFGKMKHYLSAVKSGQPFSENGNRPPKLSVIERTLQSAIQDEMSYQEGYLHLLATMGNTAPFLGLFGTVWGIMGAFQEIGRQGSANIAVVAPGVAEALINTAAGLFVAIPAVVAYNIFVVKLRKMQTQLEIYASDFLSRVEEAVETPVEHKVVS
ncbi:MAG: MotA/TolQ/ExbB proton channel family protein [Nitrospira sp.]|nr:Tol-Pal system subunit TolQ [Candidatus Manganitrophaceae bacterium]HIL34920.1 Tol-Pal system subunit TolQ [Candidatus Manganitrophaceae bacterium]